jgi:hypothetical protein
MLNIRTQNHWESDLFGEEELKQLQFGILGWSGG